MKSKWWIFASRILLDAWYERREYLVLHLLQTLLNEKQVVFKRWTTIQLYAETSFYG